VNRSRTLWLVTAAERWDRLGKRKNRLLRPRWLTVWRTRPVSDIWGADRGTPVDRWYIDRFLDASRAAIRGSVVEIKHSMYTDRFGSDVRERHVLDVDAANERATIVADLAAADAAPSDRFDCFILTQTLQLIYDVHAAVGHTHRMLRPGGVVLCTVPCVSRVSHGLVDAEFWRFTQASCERLFGDVFGSENVEVRAHGNVLAAIAFLAGWAAEEVGRRRLELSDVHFPLLVTVRAQKAG
jgi:SAM-dependent methyltransferase